MSRCCANEFGMGRRGLVTLLVNCISLILGPVGMNFVMGGVSPYHAKKRPAVIDLGRWIPHGLEVPESSRPGLTAGMCERAIKPLVHKSGGKIHARP